MQKLIAVLLVMLILLVGWYTYTSQPTSAPPQAVSAEKSQEAITVQQSQTSLSNRQLNDAIAQLQSNLSNQFQVLQANLAQVNAKVTSLNNELNQLKQQQATNTKSINATPINNSKNEVVSSSDNKLLENSDSLLSANATASVMPEPSNEEIAVQERQKLDNTLQRLNGSLVNNSVDLNRQSNLQQRLEQTFRGSGIENQVSVNSLSCSTSVCKIEIQGSAGAGGKDPLLALREKNTFGDGTQVMVVPNSVDNPTSWTLYVGSEGQALPQ